MPELILSDISVELIKTDFDDRWPAFAARTSTFGDEATIEHREGLVRRLVSDHHGVPFEHMTATWRMTLPIFTWEQAVKHRAGVSVSRESGRYRELKPHFYVPPVGRPLGQVGKAMDYEMVERTDLHPTVLKSLRTAFEASWEQYQWMLSIGTTKEIARSALPTAIMSTGVVTMNARALMHFLHLRTTDAGTSHPQFEIEQLARRLEETLYEFAPVTAKSFTDSGRVTP